MRWRQLPHLRSCMRLTTGFVCLLITGSLVASLRGQTMAQSHPEEKVTDLLLHMTALNDSMRRLRWQVSDPEKVESCLMLLQNIQSHALSAKHLTPAKVAQMPESQRKQGMLDYRLRMVHMIETMLQLETQLLRHEFDRAKETYKQIWNIAEEGHRKFRIELEVDEAETDPNWG